MYWKTYLKLDKSLFKSGIKYGSGIWKHNTRTEMQNCEHFKAPSWICMITQKGNIETREKLAEI
jgi:hypothetical protein